MTIKPVDLQVMLPRTAEIAKVQNDEHQHNLAMQQQQNNSVMNTAENRMKQVYSQDKAQEALIREKQEKQKKGKKEEKKKTKGNYGKDKELAPEPKTSTIDIRL